MLKDCLIPLKGKVIEVDFNFPSAEEDDRVRKERLENALNNFNPNNLNENVSNYPIITKNFTYGW